MLQKQTGLIVSLTLHTGRNKSIRPTIFDIGKAYIYLLKNYEPYFHTDNAGKIAVVVIGAGFAQFGISYYEEQVTFIFLWHIPHESIEFIALLKNRLCQC